MTNEMINHISDNFVAYFAILGITVIETYAMSHGINGVSFATATATIGGIAGYKIKEAKSYVTNNMQSK